MSNYGGIDLCPTPCESWDEGGHDRQEIASISGAKVASLAAEQN